MYKDVVAGDALGAADGDDGIVDEAEGASGTNASSTSPDGDSCCGSGSSGVTNDTVEGADSGPVAGPRSCHRGMRAACEPPLGSEANRDIIPTTASVARDDATATAEFLMPTAQRFIDYLAIYSQLWSEDITINQSQ